MQLLPERKELAEEDRFPVRQRQTAHMGAVSLQDKDAYFGNAFFPHFRTQIIVSNQNG